MQDAAEDRTDRRVEGPRRRRRQSVTRLAAERHQEDEHDAVRATRTSLARPRPATDRRAAARVVTNSRPKSVAPIGTRSAAISQPTAGSAVPDEPGRRPATSMAPMPRRTSAAPTGSPRRCQRSPARRSARPLRCDGPAGSDEDRRIDGHLASAPSESIDDEEVDEQEDPDDMTIAGIVGRLTGRPTQQQVGRVDDARQRRGRCRRSRSSAAPTRAVRRDHHGPLVHVGSQVGGHLVQLGPSRRRRRRGDRGACDASAVPATVTRRRRAGPRGAASPPLAGCRSRSPRPAAHGSSSRGRPPPDAPPPPPRPASGRAAPGLAVRREPRRPWRGPRPPAADRS